LNLRAADTLDAPYQQVPVQLHAAVHEREHEQNLERRTSTGSCSCPDDPVSRSYTPLAAIAA
jgi:hypothetical protein